MPVEFFGADAGVVVSMTANKINISNCDQRYCTINGSGEFFSNNMRSDLKGYRHLKGYIMLKPLLLLHCHLLTVELVHYASARTKGGLRWLNEFAHSCPL